MSSVEHLEIKPILFEKGSTKLALYGMGYVPDERLASIFENKHVSFLQPDDPENWFNLFIMHQNCESGRGRQKFRLDRLPSFLNLVIWGHEHECRINPSWNDEGVIDR